MKPEFEEIALINNEAKNRFELHYNGHFAVITYRIINNVWHLEHTIAPAELRGTGVAKALTLKVFNYIKERRELLQPICLYLHGFIQKNVEWKDGVDTAYEGYEEL